MLISEGSSKAKPLLGVLLADLGCGVLDKEEKMGKW